ncbi:MAG TPA: response regulator transcription factor [Candidatus Lumbricidophila sp.]|nr:response regulator transcription factor [Candidatus Lumbricidophila sp.]
MSQGAGDRMQVLLVEDDNSTGEMLSAALPTYGFEVSWVTTIAAARPLEAAAEVVVLDLGLPDGDGFDLVRDIRAKYDVPIIVISGRTDEADRVAALELGADDYLTKPIGPRELVARMRAILRRVTPPGDAASSTGAVVGEGSSPDVGVRSLDALGSHPTPSAAEASVRLRIDRRARRVFLDGAELPLSPKQYELLEYLARDPGALFTRNQIMAEVWDEHWFGSTRTLDVHVAALRKKLGEAARIESVRGVGLRLELVATG